MIPLLRAVPNGMRCAFFAFLVGCLVAIPVAAQEETPPEAGSLPQKEDSPQEKEAEKKEDPPRSEIGSKETKRLSQESLTGPIQYVGPDTYILLDDEGRPVPMLGMSYEDFSAAWKKSQNLAAKNRQPRFSIQEIAITGKAKAEHATLNVEITLLLLSTTQVDIPLGMAGAILQAPPQIEKVSAEEGFKKEGPKEEGPKKDEPGKTRNYLDYDPEQGGFVARFRGQPGEPEDLGQKWKITLPMVVPLERDGNKTTLTLNCPRARSGHLVLEVERAVQESTVSQGSVLTSEPLGNEKTRLRVTGLAGEFQLAWAHAESGQAELASVLSATGSILISIDGRSVHTDTVLNVRSYGGSFDRFQVRLPPGAKLIENRPSQVVSNSRATSAQGGYRVILQDEEKGIVLIQLDKEEQGPVEVRLSTEQPLGLSHSDSEVELAGFEVLGAVRQFGEVALQVDEDWHVRWDVTSPLRQVEIGDLKESFRQQLLTAAFQYDRQPWSLRVPVVRRESRVHVLPKYDLEVLQDEARLRVELAYQVPGARAFQFLVQLQGWQLTADAIESEGLVDSDRVQVTSEDQLVLPLTRASSRRPVLVFYVRRDLPFETKHLELKLPVPLADLAGRAKLNVTTIPGIALKIDPLQLIGFTPKPAMHDDAEDAGNHALRISSDASSFGFLAETVSEAVFVAERVLLDRKISTSVTTEIQVTDQQTDVEQRFDYRVQNQPLSQVSLKIPSQSLLKTPLQASLTSLHDEQETPLEVQLPDQENGSTRLLLPHPRLGSFQIRIRYSLRGPEAHEPEAKTFPRLLTVPLAMPVDGPLTSNRVTVQTLGQLEVSLASRASDSASPPSEAEPPAWKAVSQVTSEEGMARAPGSWLQLFAAESVSELSLAVERSDRVAQPNTTLERVWFQTWLAGNVRQDRAAFQFRTKGSTVAVELPPEVSPDEVEVLLNGQIAILTSRSAGRLVVLLGDAGSLSAEADSPRHTLELRYRQKNDFGVVNRWHLTPPQLVGASHLSQIYWQIVLPGDRKIVRSPRQLLALGQWDWLGSHWGRRPTMDQGALETWSGATSQSQFAPTAQQNQYLFSGLASPLSIEVTTMSRWFLVLLASGGVLGLGLFWSWLWVVLPGAHHTRFLWGLAAVVALLAVAFPTSALMLGQAALLGFVLTLLATLGARLLARRAPTLSRSLVGSSISILPASTRTEKLVLPSAQATPSSAPTVPIQISDPH